MQTHDSSWQLASWQLQEPGRRRARWGAGSTCGWVPPGHSRSRRSAGNASAAQPPPRRPPRPANAAPDGPAEAGRPGGRAGTSHGARLGSARTAYRPGPAPLNQGSKVHAMLAGPAGCPPSRCCQGGGQPSCGRWLSGCLLGANPCPLSAKRHTPGDASRYCRHFSAVLGVALGAIHHWAVGAI